MKVLVTDDSKVNRKVLGKYIGEDEHEIFYASNGQEALLLSQEVNPDVIILDVEMPELDGYTVAKRIRQMRPSDDSWIPIIFLSARIDDESIEQGIESGGDDYLSKPVSATVLRAKIFAMQRIANMRKRLVNVLDELKSVNIQLSRANQVLEELSVRDPLTNLGNRRAFEAVLNKECASAKRQKGVISLMMIDVDKFKNFNDLYGHQCGDKCLTIVGAVMMKTLPRATDFVARYGGEEFSVILPMTDAAGAMIVAQRLREAIASTPIEISPEKNVQVTVSIGIASTNNPDEFDKEWLVEKADLALYDSKQNGRNRCTLYTAT